MRIIDVRSSEGQLAILGGAFVLPTSATTVTSPSAGSLRWNTTSQDVEVYVDSWTALVPSVESTSTPYDVYGSYLGVPPSQTLWRIVFARTVVFPLNLTGSVAVCAVAPLANKSLNIKQNGASIGSINYTTTTTTGSFTFTSQITFVSGDIFEVDGPSPVDASFSTPSWAFVGTRIGS